MCRKKEGGYPNKCVVSGLKDWFYEYRHYGTRYRVEVCVSKFQVSNLFSISLRKVHKKELLRMVVIIGTVYIQSGLSLGH